METIANLWNRVPKVAQIIIILAAVGAAPFIMQQMEDATNFGLITQVNRALIYVVLALGLNIVVGFAGLLDLGYAGFFAVGAYAYGILTWPTHDIEASFFIAIWLCAIVAAFFGLFVGAPTLRLRGDYLAIVTLAFGEIIPTMVRNADDLSIHIGGWQLTNELNVTNGAKGMNPLGNPDFSFFERLFGLDPETLKVGVNPTFWYFIIVVMVFLVIFAARRLENSRMGRAWKAIREDETAAEFMGVDVVRAKLSAFALGASFSGLAGAVFASMLGAIFPDLFKFQLSIFLLIIVILSGSGNIYGVLFGGLLITIFDGVFLAQILPDLAPKDMSIESLRWLFFGVGLILVMLFRPQGIFPAKANTNLPPRPPKEAV